MPQAKKVENHWAVQEVVIQKPCTILDATNFGHTYLHLRRLSKICATLFLMLHSFKAL